MQGRADLRGRRRRQAVGLAVLPALLQLTLGECQAQSLGELAAREARRRAAIVASRMQPSAAAADVARTAAPDPTPAPSPAPAPALALAVSGGSSSVSTINRSARPVVVSAPVPHAKTETPTLQGWSAFQLKKTPAELAETARLADVTEPSNRASSRDVRLPPQHDTLRLSTGLGYLQGADWGGDITGAGKINGMQTDVSAFLTAGPMGFKWRTGRVSIFTPGGKWRGEGGDLYSDLRGLARGARVSLSAGERWKPSISFYLDGRDGAHDRTPVIAYRDRFQLLPRVRLGGEVASDGAAFLQGQFSHPRLDLTAFYRFTRAPIAGRDQGVSGTVNLGRGFAVSGALRLSDAQGDAGRWQLATVRLPLARRASVTLERSWWTASSDDGSTNALTLQLPLGPLRINQRVQWGRTDYRQRGVPFGFNRRESQSTASYTPGPWGSLYYQQSTQWFDDGRVQEWDEVTSTLQLGLTTMQFATAFPDITDPAKLRARITQQLSPTLRLEVQYGRLSAFQMSTASVDEQSRLMVTMRKTWLVPSPARGGDVRGVAVDQAGYAVPGALVRLGPYTAITDQTGAYRFTRVPDGQFELSLDKEKLPAAYAWDDTAKTLTITRSSRELIDIPVVPLNAIRGRVYLDHNGNGRFDEDEGIPNAVVAVNGSVTATNASGAYAFYNQPPGRYTIRLDIARLRKGLAPTSPPEIEVELTGEFPLSGLDFTVEKKDMPIIMRKTG